MQGVCQSHMIWVACDGFYTVSLQANRCNAAVQLPSDAEIIMATLKMRRREQTAVPNPPSTYAQDVASITSHTGASPPSCTLASSSCCCGTLCCGTSSYRHTLLCLLAVPLLTCFLAGFAGLRCSRTCHRGCILPRVCCVIARLLLPFCCEVQHMQQLPQHQRLRYSTCNSLPQKCCV